MITHEDVQRWRNLNWFTRFKLRRKYKGIHYTEVYRTLEWDDYVYWRLSNCNRIILSAAADILPDIMKTPVSERHTESERRKSYDKVIEEWFDQRTAKKKWEK